jgi:hypothetical protein
MRRRPLLAAVLLAALLAQVDRAGASPPPPTDLQVLDDDDWRAQNDFDLGWRNVAGESPIAAVHYLVREPLGTVVVGPARIDWPTQRIGGISVPHTPGAYTAEVWLEDATGAEGAPAAAKLRYDPSRPALSEPLQPQGWIGRSELPYAIRLTHPGDPVPVSGIRGYAVSIDRNAEGSPCVAFDRCTDAETDLRGGVGEDALVVDELPEGTSHVHAVAVSGSGMRSAVTGHATVRVDRTDPVTTLSGLPEGWTNRAAVLEATATDSASGMGPAAGGAPFTAIQVDDGAPLVAAGSSVAATVFESGIHTIAFYARDAAGNVDDGKSTNGHPNASPSTALLRIDRDPPSVSFTGSSDPGEPELIEARASDALSGPDPGRGRVAVRAAGSGDPFRPLPTVGAGDTLRAHWSSDEYPEGEYEFRATAYDAAGNASSTTRRLNGSQMILPNPLKARALLSAGFGGGTAGISLFVPHGRTALFGGRLVATSDAPLAGRPVRIVELFNRGAADAVRTTVIATGGDGRFRLRLHPGPSRAVFAIFAGTPKVTGAASSPLRLGVRSGVVLRASAPLARVGGRPLCFRGGVAAAAGEVPPGGVSVQLQFRAQGLDWAEFRTTKTDRRGRFRYCYRFSDDDSRGVRFQFRAFVPAQSDWPYEPWGSRPVAVRGA